MPVHCKQIDGVYRLVHNDGTLAPTGGKHKTLESCQEQMKAINANIEAAFNVVYFCPNKEKFLALAEDATGLTFEKELIYAGNFIKDDKVNEPIKFSVDANIIKHWHDTASQMLANGITIPIPLEHTTNPEKTRGALVSTRIATNKRGLPSLFGKLKFRDAEAARLAQTSDVSIFVTKDYTDGVNNSYVRPIRHIALTDYPVIPGLEKFQAIAASLIPTIGELNMPATPALLALAQQLGIQGSEAMEDEQISAAIVAMVKPTQPPQPRPPMAPRPMMGAPQLPKQLMASLTNTFRDGRTSKLDLLVTNGNITKATRDALVETWCDDDSLALSITDEIAEPATDKAFAGLVAALEKNKALNFDQKTGRQIVGLANPGSPLVNDLIANAEARATAAKNN